MKTIDFAAHYHTTPPDGVGDIHDLIGPISEDLSAYATWFEEAGYDAAVLSQTFLMGHDDVSVAARGNDELIDEVVDWEEFYALCAIPSAAGGHAAAEEFDRCLNKGYNGGAVAVKANGIDIISDELRPVLEVADNRGAPILVHPTSNSRLSTEPLADRHQHNITFGREAHLIESISTAIHEGYLEDYPNLNLVYHHLGGNIAAFLGRFALRLDPGRWSKEPRGPSYETFKSLLDSRIYIDTSGYFAEEGSLRCAIDQFPASQILLGTDAPYEPRSTDELRDYVDKISGMVDDQTFEAIAGGNALDLLVNI